MSASAAPITAAAFVVAIKDLPLGNLHAKAAELRNSIAHLQRSNEQLDEFAAEGDEVCVEALRENTEVMKRMDERVRLLRQEVERRGYRWPDAEVADPDGEHARVESGNSGANGHDGQATVNGSMNGQPIGSSAGGGLSDEELRQRLEQRMEEEAERADNDGSNGVHL